MRLTKLKGINNRPHVMKPTRVIGFSIPKLGRIAFSKDPGEASLFSEHFLRTRLSMRVIDGPTQRTIMPLTEVGAGTVTNVGVLALATDFNFAAEAKAKEPYNLFNYLKFQAWSKATVEEKYSVKMTELQKPNETEATEVTTREFNHNLASEKYEGKPKYITKGKIKAESNTEIKSWGLFTDKKLEEAAKGGGKFTSVTENSGTITGATEFTESTTEAKGERLKIALATEAAATWLLVKTNTKTVLKGEQGTVTQKKMWFEEAAGGKFKEPTGTSAFTVRPVMWDQKKFGTVTVETNNEIEFIYELEFPAGG